MSLSWLLVLASVAMAAPDRGMSTETPLATPSVPPKHRLWYTSATFARVNPLGLINTSAIGYRRRLSAKDSLLLRDTYVHVGANVRASPAFARAGAHLEVQPLAVLKLWADYEGVGYFGTFDQIYSGPDSSIRYSDQTIAAAGANTGATTGSVFTAGGVLQAAAGPIAVRSTLQLTRFDLALDDGDTVFYDQYWDRLIVNEDVALLNDLDLMGVFGAAKLGVRWTWSDTPTAAEGTDAAIDHHRLGPLFAYTFRDEGPGTRFDQPTVFVLAQGWLRHPYRTGEEQPAALPLIAVGLAFRGDLIGRP
jgi:hypothetical protein